MRTETSAEAPPQPLRRLCVKNKEYNRTLASRKKKTLNYTEKNSCCSRKLILNFFTHQLKKGNG